VRINFPDGHYLLASGNNISHSDMSGKVNLAEEVAAFLKSRGVRAEIEKVSSLDIAPFLVRGEMTFTYSDILKLACFMARRAAIKPLYFFRKFSINLSASFWFFIQRILPSFLNQVI